MKIEFLKGLGIEDDNVINQILDEVGKDLNVKKMISYIKAREIKFLRLFYFLLFLK